MATLHFIHGYIGTGKMTFAKKLVTKSSPLRISSDEWMILLPGRNPPAETFRTREIRVRAPVRELCFERNRTMRTLFSSMRPRLRPYEVSTTR